MMEIPRIQLPQLASILLSSLLWLLPGQALAEAVSDKPDRVAVDSAELVTRAEHAERELLHFENQLVVPPALSKLRDQLHQDEPEFKAAVDRARAALIRDNGWFSLADIRFEFTLRLNQHKGALASLATFRSSVHSITTDLTRLSEEWERNLVQLREIDAPRLAISRAEHVVRLARLVDLRLKGAEVDVAMTVAQIDRMNATAAEVLELTQTDGPSLVHDFSRRGPSPFAIRLPAPKSVVHAVLTSGDRSVRNATRFLQQSGAPVLFQVLVFLGLWAFLYRSRARLSGNGHVNDLIYRRPLASSALVAFSLSAVLHPAVPALVGILMLTSAVLCASRLVLDKNTSENRWFIGGGLVLTVFLYGQVVFTGLPEVQQMLLGVEGLFVVAFAVRVLVFRLEGWEPVWGRLLVIVSRTWLLAGGLGLVCWTFGLNLSASVLIDGTARLMLLSVAYRIAYAVVLGFIQAFVLTGVAQNLRMLATHGDLIVERLATLLRFGFLFLWVRAVVVHYTLSNPISENFSALVGQKLEVGSLNITVGDVLALAVGVTLAVYASRLTRFLLDEEVLPRTALGIGSRAAVTVSAGYVVFGVGLFLALAAVGFELGKITIVVSALGVGIGFGLQNIVQNFVAGIILIFGRPINVGDRVEMGGRVGTVTKVGFRSSTIRTTQGAEVIVPNSQFVSEQVINWSLSDELRRVEIDVGVKYGTDPREVLALLQRVAEGHPEVLPQPPPEALFLTFGASSLDFQLQVWTARGGAWMTLRSELSIEINRLFKEAGIEIPYPQHDLNVRTVDPLVLAAMDKSTLG